MLRDVLLPMTLDIEHFTKVRLLATAEDAGESGYDIIRNYLESLPKEQRDRIINELKHREKDPYIGEIVQKYRENMPIWVFCEIMPLGIFSSLVKFCAIRWGDASLQRVHYLLKNTRSVRNSCAHGVCSINELLQHSPSLRPPASLVNELASAGIPKRLRSKWLRGERMVNTRSTLYLYQKIVPKGTARTEQEKALRALFAAVENSEVPPENPAIAAFFFIKRPSIALGVLQ